MTENGNEITPEKRERNLNRSLDEVWAEADERRMDKALETLRQANEKDREDSTNRRDRPDQ